MKRLLCLLSASARGEARSRAQSSHSQLKETKTKLTLPATLFAKLFPFKLCLFGFLAASSKASSKRPQLVAQRLQLERLSSAKNRGLLEMCACFVTIEPSKHEPHAPPLNSLEASMGSKCFAFRAAHLARVEVSLSLILPELSSSNKAARIIGNFCACLNSDLYSARLSRSQRHT